MGRVLSNNTGLQVAFEASVGVLPASPTWQIVERNTIGAYGAVITTVARRPVSNIRGRKKGVPTTLTSSVEFETDTTYEAISLFAEGFMFAEYTNTEFYLRATGGFLPPAVTGANTFGIAAASSTLAGKVQWSAGGVKTLLFGKGYTQAAANGVHVLGADLTTSQTSITVTSTMVAETPPTNATLEVTGIRTDDLTVVVASGLLTGTITSAGDVDWTTLGLTKGQFICLGSPNASGVVQNAPTIGSTDIYGCVRITNITATVLSFDKAESTIGLAGAGTSVGGGETIDVMFGRFARNVATDANSTDNRYLERYHQFELSFPNLESNGATAYEYALGNLGNELTFNNPLTALATMNLAFVGTTSDPITATRKTALDGASSATVQAGGSGYTDGDVLTLVGGTGTAATFTASVTAGAVTGVTLLTAGSYSVTPSNPVATTAAPPGGTGCTLNVTYVPIPDPVRSPLRTAGFSTSANLASITTDVTSLASEVCFKSLTLAILNNASPEYCLGTYGATFINAGLFQADVEGQMLFTNKSIVNAIRNNTTVTLAFKLANEDGVAFLDIPSMTLGGGGREFPVDQSVLVNITGASFTSNTFGYDLGISLIPAAPGVLALAA